MWMISCRPAVLGLAMLIGAAVSRAAPVANDEVAQAIKRMGSDDAQERADAAAGLRARTHLGPLPRPPPRLYQPQRPRPLPHVRLRPPRHARPLSGVRSHFHHESHEAPGAGRVTGRIETHMR
jgi:hypothetical protein